MARTAKIEMRLLKKSIITFIVLFLITFAARTAYELIFTGKDIIVTYESNYNDLQMDYGEKGSYGIKSNIASERVSQKNLDGQNITIDQKYEMTANITSASEQFTEDNKSLRQIIEQNNAVIQTENLDGLPGKRSLVMAIGVMPDNFDVFVELIQKIGQVKSFNVNKVDKTNEYRELMAQKETLQKSIDSYTEMKKRGGDIKDLLLLEDKILETQQQIQNIGVNLGVFSSENSFCTINFSMKEISPMLTEGNLSIRFMLSCIKEAFFWTAFLYFLLFVFIICALFGIWLLLFGYALIKAQLSLKNDSPEDTEHKENKTLIE